MLETRLDRFERFPGLNLAPLRRARLQLGGQANGMTRTLAYAAVGIGLNQLELIGDRSSLRGLADEVMAYLGDGAYVPVYSAAALRSGSALEDETLLRIIDAGDPNPQVSAPEDDDELVYCYGKCRREDGAESVAIWRPPYPGPDAPVVPLEDRAEVSMIAALLLIAIIADLEVAEEIDPLEPTCVIPLARLPEKAAATAPTRLPDQPERTILIGGGGGAIAHQLLWAMSLDPALKAAAQRAHFVVVDPKEIHESCRARQFLYSAATLGAAKALETSRRIETLFPGARATAVCAKVGARHFAEREITECVSSVDNWAARRVLADECRRRSIPWWSAGSSWLGGFARRLDPLDPACADADEGVERLRERPPDDLAGSGNSCSAETTPAPSSVLPQMLLAAWAAVQMRSLLLGQANPEVLARGLEVHIDFDGDEVSPGYENFPYRCSPGRLVNLRKEKRHGHP